jgi:S1-C subfamily serine protease
MRKIAILAAFLIIFGFSTVAYAAFSDKAIENAKSAVVAIYTDQSIHMFRGSGFFYSRNAIITAGHVVEGYSRVWGLLNDGRKIELIPVNLQDNNDLAILLPFNSEYEKMNFPYLNFGNIKGLDFGGRVAAIGSTKDNLWQVVYGIIQNVNQKIAIPKTKAKPITIVYNPGVPKGFSGSPLIDENGDVIGVNAATLQSVYGYAISLVEIQPFIEEFYQKLPEISKLIEEIIHKNLIRKECNWIEIENGRWCKN